MPTLPCIIQIADTLPNKAMLRDMKSFLTKHGMRQILKRLHNLRFKDKELVEELAEYTRIFGSHEEETAPKKA